MNQFALPQIPSRVGRLAVIVALVGLILSGTGTTVAQESSPVAGTNPFADTGLPEIAVTVTDTAYEGVPAELTAGRYILTLTNASTTPNPNVPPFLDFLGAALVKVPANTTSADFLAMLSEPPTTPMSSPEAGPPPPPAWLYETVLAGGSYAYRGQTASAVIDLSAGDWVLWGEDQSTGQPPVPVTVTGDAPADQPTPTTTMTIEGTEFAFSVGDVSAGPQIIQFTNIGQQPHFLAIAAVPDGTTVDEFIAFAAGTAGPSSTPSALDPATLTLVLNTGNQSSAVTAWYAADLLPGSYIAICFVVDPETGMPHAMLGMVHLFTVA